MIVVFWVAGGTAKAARKQCWVESKARAPPEEHVPKCDIHNGKKPQLIQKHLHKILTNVKQFLKNRKDAQISSACTGSAW